MIAGINCFTHDVTSVLLGEEKVIEINEEERYSRKRHHDGFVFCGLPPYYCVDKITEKCQPDSFAFSKSVEHSGKVTNTVQQRFLDYAHYIDPTQKKTRYYSHHLCHAASTFFSSKFERSYVCTLDSEGDGLSLCIFIGENNDLTKIFEVPSTSSICKLYSYASELVGLGKRSEGSMLGLAAYGKVNEFMDNIIKWSGSCLSIKNIAMLEQLGKGAKTFQQRADFAATVQEAFKDTVISILTDICTDKSIRNISLAGGGFLNCTLVGEVARSVRWDGVYVTPLANDAGTALGAALLASENRSKFIFEHTFHGASFTKDIVRESLSEWGVNFKESTASEIAHLLTDGKVGGIFHGNMEAGPRALGHRSIIADPRNSRSRDKINKIKKRQFWRPVAPSVLHEYGEQYFESYRYSPFMTESFVVKDDVLDKIPSVVHANQTARVQSVTEGEGLFYDVLVEFERLTKTPMLCNSSLNIHEPIACTPADAVKILFTSALDFLFIEGFLITK